MTIKHGKITKDVFRPYVSPNEAPKEMSFRALFLGLLLGLVFCVGNAYLGLRIGSTISASIPAAVFSMAILRFFKDSTILENNIVQTVAAVGEGLAAGVAFTIPALFMLGTSPNWIHLFLLSFLGGVLGILFMIPMRRYVIVKEHGVLPFPEGTACAEILKSAKDEKGNAIMAGIGLIVGSIYKLLNSAFYLWDEVVSITVRRYQSTLFSMDCTPSLLGVGYIIGPRISALMFTGGMVGWWVLIPLIKMFGQGEVTIFPSAIPIAQMNATEIWSNYIRYIGAGTVAFGGIISLVRIAPLIWKTIHDSFCELFKSFQEEAPIRTDHDISMKWLIIGSVAIILTLWLFPGFPMNLFTVGLLVVIGFFFTCVTSITVGLVGSTSNPVSGMTITTLLITCFIFVGLGWTDRVYLLAAITMSCVANVAIALAATTSQDLKTGYILGATPRKQQIAELIGLILPSLAIGGTLYLLNKAYGFGTPALPAPQATLISMIAKGVIANELPVTLVFIGVVLGVLIELMSLPILPFAIGLYLPLSLSTAIMVGGVTKGFVKRLATNNDSEQRGLLTASGLVAGDACTGVIVALLTVLGIIPASKAGLLPNFFSLIFYLALGIGLTLISIRSSKKSKL
ncbi:MAG: oligopeptide transporter, OPT family [Simkaniaceae bacterium]